MFKIRSIAACALVAAIAATGAAADTFSKFGEVEGWTVYVDSEKASCLIERATPENIVQMGLTKDHKFGYLGVFSTKDTGVKKGQKEDIFIDIDGVLFSSQATGMKGNITEGYTGGYILANNPVFIEAVAKKYVMTVFPEKEAMFTVDLKGTYNAMDMARKCNAEQG